MLGENHSLRVEFPDHLDTITALNSSNPEFAKELKKYDLLDQEIRKLELRNSPISDETTHQLKQERLKRKDALYKMITASEK